MKESTLKYFENTIFKQYGETTHFEKCRKCMLNVLETMTNEISWFEELSNSKKYRICQISSLIAVQSEREAIAPFSIIKEEKETKHGVNRKNPKFDLKQIPI